MTQESRTIACTLGNDELRDRRAWIAELMRDALLEHRRGHLVLHLDFRPEAAARVREMVRLERACCAFLTFHIDEQPNQVLLTITAPEAAREAADVIFDQFTAPARPTASSRGCRSDAQS